MLTQIMAAEQSRLRQYAVRNSVVDYSCSGRRSRLLENSAAAQKGLKPTFDTLYIHNIELSTAIGEYLQSASTAQQAALQKSLSAIHVKLNPRYGSWSLDNLAVDDPATPSWLKSAS